MPEPPVGSDLGSDPPADEWTAVVAALPELLTTKEAALVLRVEIDTLRRLAKTGQVPAVKVGGDWRYFKTRLLDHLHGRTAPPYQS
ncbi:MAG: helix-turn-helix domain-containing protein [Pseudonocardiaceae bacterium]